MGREGKESCKSVINLTHGVNGIVSEKIASKNRFK